MYDRACRRARTTSSQTNDGVAQVAPSSASVSASSPTRASASSGSPECLIESIGATLRLTKRTSSLAKIEREAVVKSLQRVPTPSTTSASRARAFASVVPVAPIAPADCGWSKGSEPLPACVSATGIPVAAANAAKASVASE